jgi:hypothetical protein
MIKRFTNFVLIGAIWLTAVNCNKDEVTKPPKPTLSVDQTSGLVGDTEFTFTVTEVNADAVSLLPYGVGGDAGIRITSFNNGVATVKFKYAKPGTFNAVVRSNNHSDDGESSNTLSEPVQIVIASDDNQLTDFKFDKVSTKTVIDQNAKTVVVTVPYGTDITKLKGTFTSSAFSTVSVDGAAQTSGTTENNFTTPKVYRVTANNGLTNDYTVSVVVTPIETNNNIASATAKATSKAMKDKALPVYVDNTARTIVVYDVLGAPKANFDSVRIGYKLSGSFSNLKYNGKKLKQDSLFNLADATIEEFTVHPQDSLGATGVATYKVYATDAPKLLINFPTLNPQPIGASTPTDFAYNIKVLSGTNTSSLPTTLTTDAPTGVVVNSVLILNNDGTTSAVPANMDFTVPVKIQMTVTDSRLGTGVTYKVVYTISVSTVQ